MLEVRLSGQQAQLRALYELQLQWAESAARAHEAAKLLSAITTVTRSCQGTHSYMTRNL